MLNIQAKIALDIATKAHEGQTRRDGTPYIEHPKRVAARVANLLGLTHELLRDPETLDQLTAVALLHDVLEDTQTTESELISAGLLSSVVDSVVSLTKTLDTTEENYLNYLDQVAQHPMARLVKIADMIDNLSDSPTRKQVIRYSHGLSYLMPRG